MGGAVRCGQDEKTERMKSIIQDEKKCFITGSTEGLHKHHCIGGINRRLADEDGLWVWLRWDYHIADSPNLTPHNSAEAAWYFQRLAQRKYEETHTREEFMARYGRNYLGDEDEDDD